MGQLGTTFTVSADLGVSLYEPTRGRDPVDGVRDSSILALIEGSLPHPMDRGVDATNPVLGMCWSQ